MPDYLINCAVNLFFIIYFKEHFKFLIISGYTQVFCVYRFFVVLP